MLAVEGNLGNRQRQLNAHVNRLAKLQEKFKKVKNIEERSDIDTFIKIDLASKYMNIGYIVKVLKAGDSLHTTRVLRCPWIYGDDYSEIINPAHLHQNLFPFMSIKMRKKMLINMSKYLKNSERAANFIKYSMDIQLPKLALKFAVRTTDRVKLEFLKENSDLLEEVQSKTYLKHFIGTSFTLADKLISLIHSELNKVRVLYNLRHLYALSDVTYIDILERYVECTPFNNPKRLGSTITKHIMKNHKTRVIEHIKIYINLLHMKTVSRFVTPDDAKTIVLELHPKTENEYWSQNFCVHYEVLINKIPHKERFPLLRSMFKYKYSCQPFETSIQFYIGQFYKLMTEGERLQWILDQQSGQGIKELGRSYALYNCLKFETAFEKLTELIEVTTVMEKRTELTLILLETVKNQCHMKILLDYYYDNRNHEPGHAQELFINRLLQAHQAYYFNSDCWTVLNKIFRRLGVYDSTHDNAFALNFRVTAVIYYILNHNNLPEELIIFITNNPYLFELHLFTRSIIAHHQEKIYKYLFNFYFRRIPKFDPEVKMSSEVKMYITYILDLMSFYGRTKEDVPKELMNFVRSDCELETHRLIHKPTDTVTQKEMMKLLKVDPGAVLEKFPLIKRAHETVKKFKLGQLLKKMKVYFSNDLSQQYIKFYHDWLLTSSLLSKTCTEAVCFAIFILGDDAFKVNFMKTNAPVHGTIEKNKVDAKMLRIQHAICATVFHSRPPVSLKMILMYVKGQYIRSCLPLITFKLVNLPENLCTEFLETILNTPPLAQKHGVRVAFACFTVEKLKKLILYLWKKHKTVLLRQIIYKALYNKIVKENEYAKTALFESLITFTSELNENDIDIFKISISGGLPNHLVSDYLNAVWIAVNSLPITSINIRIRSAVIEHFCTMFYSLRQIHIRPIIEDFIEDLFDVLQAKIIEKDDDTFYLYNKKWELAGKYVTYVRNEKDLEVKTELAQLITTECLGVFNVSDGAKYIGRDLLVRFIRYLQDESYLHPFVCYEYVNVIFEKIIDTLKDALPFEQLYFIVWEIHADIAVRKAFTNIQIHCSEATDLGEKITIVRDALSYFGQYIGNIIRYLVENDMYYRSLAPFVGSEMYRQINKIVSLTGNLEPEDVVIATSLALIQFKTRETYMFALLLLPKEYTGCYLSDYNTILNEIKNCTDIEVITLMFQKFVNSDHKPRDFLKL